MRIVESKSATNGATFLLLEEGFAVVREEKRLVRM